MYSHKKINPMPGEEGRTPVRRPSNVSLMIPRYGVIITGLEKIQKYNRCDDRNLVTDFGGIFVLTCVQITHTRVCLLKVKSKTEYLKL